MTIHWQHSKINSHKIFPWEVTGGWLYQKLFFPRKLITFTQTFFYYVHTTKKKEDEENLDGIDEEKAEETGIGSEPFNPYYQKLKIRPSMYSHINTLLFEMRSKVNLLTEDGKHKSTENGLKIKFDAYAGYTFPNRNIPNLLGFKGEETALVFI